jgi:hypothetical protein
VLAAAGVEDAVGGFTGTFGALCFCQASQSISPEKVKITAAIRRWISIGENFEKGSGHRVVTAGMPWMASQYAPGGKVRSAQCTVPFNRLDRITRTRGSEPALPAPIRAEQVLVQPDERNQDA